MPHADGSFTFSADGDDQWIVETSRGRVTITMIGNEQCRVEPESWLTPAVVTVRATVTDVLSALQRLVAADERAQFVLEGLAGTGRQSTGSTGRLALLVRGLVLATAGLLVAGLVVAAVISGQLA